MKENKIPLHAGAKPHQFENAKNLRMRHTGAEKILWEKLRAKRFLNLKFRRQHPLHAFIVDFYCHSLRLIIEIDGDYHNEKEQNRLDHSRTSELEVLGFKVIRFDNEQIISDLEGVMRNLKQYIRELKNTSPKSSPEGEDFNS